MERSVSSHFRKVRNRSGSNLKSQHIAGGREKYACALDNSHDRVEARDVRVFGVQSFLKSEDLFFKKGVGLRGIGRNVFKRAHQAHCQSQSITRLFKDWSG